MIGATQRKHLDFILVGFCLRLRQPMSVTTIAVTIFTLSAVVSKKNLFVLLLTVFGFGA
jgi:hypothetical protein